MDFKQRKTHKFIWLILALGLPFFLFFSVKSLDFSTTEKKEKTGAFSNSSTTLKTTENEWVKASENSGGLEMLLKKPIKSASSIVYELTEDGEKGKTLGQVSTPGIYSFPDSTY